MSNVPSDWEVVIGLEVHVQLHTRANGMPELHKLTPPLAVLQGKGFKVALVTDGRMSQPMTVASPFFQPRIRPARPTPASLPITIAASRIRLTPKMA